MEAVFIKVLNMSITASRLALAIILLRLLLKKAPKAIFVFMWALVGIRLICPFSPESMLSLIPTAETVPADIIYSNTQVIDSGLSVFNSTVNPIISESLSPKAGASINPMQVIAFAASFIWILGIAAMLLYTVVSCLRIHRKVREAVPYQDNIRLCDRIDTPFILGIIRPCIYMPSDTSSQDAEYIIAHEKAHLKRHDHWLKPLAFLILSVHWFNPVIWAAYLLLCKDIELACDEKVIKDMGAEIKKPYSNAIINCSTPRRMISACPLAFGEASVKSRVKSVLNYKKPGFLIIVAAVVTGIAVAVCFLTDPKTQIRQSDNYTIVLKVISAECDNVEYEYMYGTLNESYPYICVNWTNKTDDTLCFGDEFTLYKNDKELEPDNSMAFDSVLHIVRPSKSKSENYVLSSYNLEKGAKYLLKKSFYLESKPEQKYTAFISFVVDTRFSFIDKQYSVEKVVYADESCSYAYTKESLPQFKISELSEFLYKREGSPDEWKRIDGLQPIKLKRSDFDCLFTSSIWENGTSARKIRKNNLNAFSAFDLDGTVYYLLEQKNGDIYIAQSNGLTSDFCRLFKLKEIEQTAFAELGNNTNENSVGLS